ncbi:MAG: O-antigen ligase family protein [Chitinophagaceae bacterium]
MLLKVRLYLIVGILFCIFLGTLFYVPLIRGWVDTPNVYVLLGAMVVVSVLSIALLPYREPHIRYVDWIPITIGCLCLSCIDYSGLRLSNYLLRDELLTAISVLSLYLPFRQLVSNGFSNEVSKMLCFSVAIHFVFTVVRDFFPIMAGHGLNTGVYCIFLACLVPVFLDIEIQCSIVVRWMIRVVLFLFFLFIAMTESRTAIVVFLLGLFPYLKTMIAHRFRYLFMGRTSKGIIVIFLSVLFVVLFLMKIPSAIGRLLIWKISFGMFLQRPFVGWGIGGFEANYLSEQAAYLKNTPGDYKYLAGNTVVAFNEIVELLVTLGVFRVGVVLYVCYYVFSKLKTNNGRRLFRNPYFLCLIQIAFSSFFYYSLHFTPIIILALYCLARLPDDITSNRWGYKKTFVVFFLMGVLYLTGCTVVVYNNVMQYRATARWKSARKNILERTEYAIFQYRKAYPYLKNRYAFLYNFGAELYECGAYSASVLILEQARLRRPDTNVLTYLGKAYQACGDDDKAEACFRLAINTVPSKFYPRLYLALLMQERGHKKVASQIAKDALSIPIKRKTHEVVTIRNQLILIEADSLNIIPQ